MPEDKEESHISGWPGGKTEEAWVAGGTNHPSPTGCLPPHGSLSRHGYLQGNSSPVTLLWLYHSGPCLVNSLRSNLRQTGSVPRTLMLTPCMT